MEGASARLEGGHVWLPKKYRDDPRNTDHPKIIQKLAPAIDPKEPNRVPGLGFMSGTIRNHFVAMTGEFVGTFLFLFFAFTGTQVANTTQDGQTSTATTQINKVLFIALCFGFSLAVNAWVFFRISGGLFNPAVTLGMCLVGAVPWFRGGLLLISQIIGAIASAAVVEGLFPGPLVVRTTLQAGTSIAQGLFIEMFLTAQLVFTIFMLAAEKHKATFIAPIGIGLALFIAELGGVYFTGGSLNPARSFGPDVVLHTFDGYHWIYWLGPALGAIVASGFYFLMKKLEYETANPNQDQDQSPVVEDPEKGLSDQDLPGSRKSMQGKRSTRYSDADTLHANSRAPASGDYSYGYWVPVQRPGDDSAVPNGAVLYMREDPHHAAANGNPSHARAARDELLTGEQESTPTSKRQRRSSRGNNGQHHTAAATAYDGNLRVNNVEYATRDAGDRTGLHAVHVVDQSSARDIVGQDRDIARRKVT